MDIKITILSNDIVTRADYLAEHGFSALIEAENSKILFDTGQGMVLLHNAALKKIDLSEIDSIVLSHGHYDHANGLEKLSFNKKIKVFAHPQLFRYRYKETESGEYKNIGPAWLGDERIMGMFEFALCASPCHLSENVILSGEIPRVTDFEQADEPFLLTDENNRYLKDDVNDDQALFIKTGNGIVILTGCAHSGLINTVLHAKKVTGSDEIRAIIGGTHLVKLNIDKLNNTIDYIRKFKIRQLLAGHCTAFESLSYLKTKLGDMVQPLDVGKEIIIN